jgi:hypothetical protein
MIILKDMLIILLDTSSDRKVTEQLFNSSKSWGEKPARNYFLQTLKRIGKYVIGADY